MNWMGLAFPADCFPQLDLPGDLTETFQEHEHQNICLGDGACRVASEVGTGMVEIRDGPGLVVPGIASQSGDQLFGFFADQREVASATEHRPKHVPNTSSPAARRREDMTDDVGLPAARDHEAAFVRHVLA